MLGKSKAVEKILIVDDSETIRSQLRTLLEEEGYQIIEAEDGTIGLELASSNEDIQLIICDFNMPEMDGITMTKKVKEIKHFKDLPIFMLTTESTVELKKLGKEAGIMAWIVKPYEPNKLRIIIKKILRAD